MGRKLNALEELQASLENSNADRQDGQAQLRLNFLERIADQLGITTAQLGELPIASTAVQPAIDPVRQSELVLTQQCADLVEAFLKIESPQDRLRCLAIVRAAAGVKSLGSAH